MRHPRGQVRHQVRRATHPRSHNPAIARRAPHCRQPAASARSLQLPALQQDRARAEGPTRPPGNVTAESPRLIGESGGLTYRPPTRDRGPPTTGRPPHQKHRGTPQTGPAPNTTPPHRTRPHPLTRPPRARKGASRNTRATPPGRSQTMRAAGNTAPQRQDRPARQAPTTPHTTPRTTQPTRAPKHKEEVNMATSRTGTAKWLRIRRQAIKQAIENNIFNCPTCGVGLDY